MNHDHPHAESKHEHGAGCGCGHSHQRQYHRDWRIWLAVVVMLGAMVIYLLTQNNSVGPGGQPASAVTPPPK